MNYWEALQQSVRSCIQAGQIGTPVFVRCTAITADTQDVILSQAAGVIMCLNDWFSSVPAQIYAVGQETSGHCAVTLQYPTGATAILSVSLDHSQPNIDLTVIGSEGAAYHSQTIQTLRDGSLMPLKSGELESVVGAIRSSLSLNRPVEINMDGVR